MSPLGGTRYDTYAADWMTWSRGDVPGLKLTDMDVGLLRESIVTSCLKALIGLLEYSYNQDIPSFHKVQLQRISGLSMLGPEQFL
jgi:hypothetical protein